MAKLITAGCGISQIGFDKWPTWPKYCVLSHACENINVGGPASGNEHIARSVVRAVYEHDPNCVIVVWTSYNKLDVYVEDFSKHLQIKNFPTRNFLINHRGRTVEAPGWWPSSVSDDNLFKKMYKETLESNTYYYIRTLESVLSVQNLCKLKNIPCYMFLGYDWDFKVINSSSETKYLYNAIDWNMFRHMDSLENDYINSPWFEYNTTKKNGMVPVAGWQYEFYVREIMPILDQHYPQRELLKFWELEKTALEITQDRYERNIS
jgi:hypothetical protein